MNWLKDPIAPPCPITAQGALSRQAMLTKPPGALGRLEELAVRLAAMQRTDTPRVDKVWISVFAADHGVAAENVSAFPQSVTREMVRNFAHGGAAICVLAKQLNAHLEIIDVGVLQSAPEEMNVIPARAGAGTRNFVDERAMTQDQLALALKAGAGACERALASGAQLYIGGEMGIGNTTAASALACLLLDAPAEKLVGPGTGLNQNGIEHKRVIVERARKRHARAARDPLKALTSVGGFEIAALTGAYVCAAQRALPILIDGFISSVAALIAVRINPASGDWFIYAPRSPEPGHRMVLAALDSQPLLDLNMRLGEGSGAAVAVPLLRAACALHNEMATFEQAQVSRQQ